MSWKAQLGFPSGMMMTVGVELELKVTNGIQECF
jgi:hypothetical protein